MQRVPDDKREEWVMQMNAPLPGTPQRKHTPTQAELEADGDSFMAAMAMTSKRR